MKINISVPEEMQIVSGVVKRIRKLKSMKGDHSSEINHCKEVLEKINQANFEEAQEIMRNEG